MNKILSAMNPPSNRQVVSIYRSIIRKANTELKYTNYEYFRIRLNNSFKEPVESSYMKFRKYQDAEFLLNNNLGSTL